MSTQGDIYNFLAALQRGLPDGEFIPLTPNQIAMQTGFASDKVNKTLSNLAYHKKVELRRGDNGRAIVGLRIVGDHRPNSASTRTQHPASEPPVRRRGIGTPLTDEYAHKKAQFARMVEEFGDLVQATFNENPYAEEALRIKARLDAIEPRFSEMSRELDETNRELRALKARKRQEIAESVAKNGAMVMSGD